MLNKPGKPPVNDSLIRKSAYAIADQILVSGSNFVVTLSLARYLPKEEFGIYVLALSVLLFSHGLHTAIICSPISVLVSAMDEGAAGKYLRALTPGQRLITISLSCLMVIVALVIRVIPDTAPYAPSFFAVAIISFFYLGQDYLRFILFSRMRLKDAFKNDFVCYGLQVLAILLLVKLQKLNAVNAILAIGITSMMAWMYGLVQCADYRGRSEKGIVEGLEENYNYGKWLIGTSLVAWLRSNLYLYISLFFLGVSAPAILRAVQTLFGPTHIVLNGTESIVPQYGTRLYTSYGKRSLDSFLNRFVLCLFAVIAAYTAVTFIFTEEILDIVFKGRYTQYSTLVWIIGIQYLFITLQKKPVISLRVIKKPHFLFKANAIDLVVSGILSFVLIYLAGLEGAALSKVLSSLVILYLSAFYYRRDHA